MITIQRTTQGLNSESPFDLGSFEEYRSFFKGNCINEECEEATRIVQSSHDGGGTTDGNPMRLTCCIEVLGKVMMGVLPGFSSFAQAQRVWAYLWENVFHVDDSYDPSSSSFPCATSTRRERQEGSMECFRVTKRLARRCVSIQTKAAIDYALKCVFLIDPSPLPHIIVDNESFVNENTTASELVEATARRMQQTMMHVLEKKEQ
ncbi:unnamed protein product [Phytomonas sp. Hart1]|nr:unnamed protein product [Phytomonas sp. Hart1]|eukprot:CCW65995.1 unnamed protein product [Phytomonas sp. isolate Hart1]